MKKLILTLAAILLVPSWISAAMTNSASKILTRASYITAQNKNLNPLYKFANEIENDFEEWTLDGNTVLTFGGNGLTISNATNNTMTFAENSEDLVFTFGTNDIALSSSTGVLGIDFKAIYIAMDEISAPSGNPAANKGWLYVKDDGAGATTLYFEDSAGTASSCIAGAGAVSLDSAYGVGSTIDVDGDAVTLTVSDTDNNRVLDLVQNDTTNNPSALKITNAGTGDSLEFAGTSGNDIDGSGSTWSVTTAGVLTAVSGDFTGAAGLTLENDDTITNTVDTEITLTDGGGEDLIFDLDAGVNAVGLKSSTGVDELAMGTVDDLTGVGTIVFDAVASTVTLTSDGDADDLTVALAGNTDSSLKFTSTGTGADAISFITVAGGLDITVAGASSGAAEDLDLTSNTAINLTSSEASERAIYIRTTNAAGQIKIVSADTSADGITLQSAGGFDINAVDTITFDTSGAGKDITVDSALGSVKIEGGEAIATAVVIGTSDAAGGIDMNAGTGGIAVDITGAADFRLDSSAGSIVLVGAQAAADAITIDAEDAAGGIDMDYGTGGMVLTGTGVAANLTIDVDALSFDFTDSSNISVTSSEAAEDLTISQITGNDSSIIITSAGTGTNAVEITTSDVAGDIDINAGDALTLDTVGNLTITCGGTLSFADGSVTNVGDISCDDIIDDTSGDIMYMVKTVIKTIDVDDDASTDDFTFDDDAVNQTEQPVDLGAIIPAYAEIVSAQIRCFEQVTGAAVMAIDLGTASGGAEILATANTDDADDINATAAGDGPEVVATNAARHVWINATPGANWNTLDAGRWSVIVTYIDYGAAHTQKNP